MLHFIMVIGLRYHNMALIKSVIFLVFIVIQNWLDQFPCLELSK
jgi:hypothetical protein